MGIKTKSILILTAWLLLSACSSRPLDGQSSNKNSNLAPSIPGVSTPASCNSFSDSSSGLTGRIKAYYDQFGNYNSQWVRLRLSGVPTNFGNSDNLYIEFYRWRISPTGAIEQDSTPLRFRLEDPTSGAAASNWYGPNGSGTNLGFNRQALFQVANSQDMNQLLNYTFLVQGTDLSLGYQVLRIVLSNSNGGSSSNAGYSDMLIPIFEANPNTYAATHHATLNQLHPNWSQQAAGWTDANYLAFTQQLCF